LIWTQRQIVRPQRKRAKGRCKLVDGTGMPGAGLTVMSAMSAGQARPDRLALKPYWGKLTVRNFREGDENVGSIRSPVRDIALPDLPVGRATVTLPYPNPMLLLRRRVSTLLVEIRACLVAESVPNRIENPSQPVVRPFLDADNH
jgi:hypothetical protein